MPQTNDEGLPDLCCFFRFTAGCNGRFVGPEYVFENSIGFHTVWIPEQDSAQQIHLLAGFSGHSGLGIDS